MLNLNNEETIKIAIWFVAFIFPLVILYRGILITFINTGNVGIYWIAIPFLISLGVLLKVKLARWLMIFWLYLLFFYEFIGTNTGMTICFSNNIQILLYDWSIPNFIHMFPYLAVLIIFYGFFIFILSTNTAYKLFGLDKSIRMHELLTFGLMAFSIIYFDMLYYWFLS